MLYRQKRQTINDLSGSVVAKKSSNKEEKNAEFFENEFKNLYYNAQAEHKSGQFQKLVMKLISQKNQLLKNYAKRKFFLLKTIRPSHPILIFWNFIKILLVLHTFFSFPLQDAFGQDFAFKECQIMNNVIIAEFYFLIVDILLRFNMSLYYKGELITSKLKITKIYLKNGFLWDFIALFGFVMNRHQFFFENCHEQSWSFPFVVLKYIFFLKISQLSKFLKFLRHELDIRNRYKSYYELSKLLLIVIMMAHIIVQNIQFVINSILFLGMCMDSSWKTFNKLLWIFLASLEKTSITFLDKIVYNFTLLRMYDNDDGRYKKPKNFDNNHYQIPQGYGDVLPQNEFEYGLCICIMLLSCGIFAYTLNTITSVLSELNKEKSAYKKDVEIIQNYMLKKGIDNTLQKRVKNYLKGMWQSGQMDPQNQELVVLGRLSQTLQNEINLQDKGKMLLRVPFLVNNFSLKFIKRLMKVTQEVPYCPDEYIQVQGQAELNSGMFIVFSGQLELLYERYNPVRQDKSKVSLGILKKGDCFNIQSLFLSQNNRFSIKSKGFSIVYFISKEDYLEQNSLQTFLKKTKTISEKNGSEDFEKFYMFRDQLLFAHQQSSLFLQCLSCKKLGHDIMQCDNLFYIPQRHLIIARSNKTEDQERSVQGRRKRKKLNALATMNIHKDICKAVRQDLDCSFEMSQQSFVSDSSNMEGEPNSSENEEQIKLDVSSQDLVKGGKPNPEARKTLTTSIPQQHKLSIVENEDEVSIVYFIFFKRILFFPQESLHTWKLNTNRDQERPSPKDQFLKTSQIQMESDISQFEKSSKNSKQRMSKKSRLTNVQQKNLRKPKEITFQRRSQQGQPLEKEFEEQLNQQSFYCDNNTSHLHNNTEQKSSFQRYAQRKEQHTPSRIIRFKINQPSIQPYSMQQQQQQQQQLSDGRSLMNHNNGNQTSHYNNTIIQTNSGNLSQNLNPGVNGRSGSGGTNVSPSNFSPEDIYRTKTKKLTSIKYLDGIKQSDSVLPYTYEPDDLLNASEDGFVFTRGQKEAFDVTKEFKIYFPQFNRDKIVYDANKRLLKVALSLKRQPKSASKIGNNKSNRLIALHCVDKRK